MQHFKLVLLVVFATIAAEARFIRPRREREVSNVGTVLDNLAKLKEELKRGCRPRPGSPWCTGKRQTAPASGDWLDLLKDCLNHDCLGKLLSDTSAIGKRELEVENGDHVKERRGCRPRPGSPWCTKDKDDDKRGFVENDELAMQDELSN